VRSFWNVETDDENRGLTMGLRRGSHGRRLASYECLVELRPGGSRPPLFLVCWEGGRLVGYRDLVKSLPSDLPIYGLRCPRFDRRSALYPEPRLEELARAFLSEVRRFQAEPPYLLGGYCFGGTLAHEIARQLEAEGQTTAFLGLIESSPYGHGEGGRKQQAGLLERERAKFKKHEYRHRADVVRFAADRLFGRFSWWRRRLRRLAYRMALNTGASLPGRLWSLEQLAIQTGMGRYVTPSSNAQITLFEARDPELEPEPTIWSRLARGGVNTHYVDTAPGTGHLALMKDPYAGRLAEMIGTHVHAATGGS
jgi:thioesterase domain-containing protein